jgi:hypothetical protein
VEVQPGVTTNQASLASNPNSSPEKGRAVIDTIIGYMNPRIIAALSLSDALIAEGSPCDDGNALTVNDAYQAGCICEGAPIGIEETVLADGLSLQPNPAHDLLRVVSEKVTILGYELYDATGRRARTAAVNARCLLPHGALRRWQRNAESGVGLVAEVLSHGAPVAAERRGLRSYSRILPTGASAYLSALDPDP